jgi:CRISPR-associated protein Csm2
MPHPSPPPRPNGARQHQGPPDSRGPNGGRGRFASDEDRRRAIQGAFGTDYTTLILEPHRGDYNDYLDRVKRFVERRARSITPSQLRNIFTRVKAADHPQKLWMLRPQLAYIAGRADKEEMRELVVLLDDLIQKVTSPERVSAFKNFFEAVIAYHKYFNPKGG